MTTPRKRQYRPETRISRAIKILAAVDGPLAPDDLARRLEPLCETREQRINLTNDLDRNGYTERVILVTRRAKARAGL